jgi:hypothetical protein
MNKAAQQLGRLGKGKKKTLAQEEIERRKKRLADAREKRWPKKDGDNLANASYPTPKATKLKPAEK